MNALIRKMFNEAWIVTGLLIFTSATIFAGSPGDLTPRVPPAHLESAKSLHNPLTPSADILAKGKTLYEGKALCSACHGFEGAGGRTSGGRSSPSSAQQPTNFADAAWQAVRTDGEIFWVLKHGSHGTDMAPYMPLYLSEDQVWHIVTYIRMFGDM